MVRAAGEREPEEQGYEPLAYWQALHRQGGLSAVASPWLPETLNEWFYMNWARNLRRFADRHDLHPASVFDVGAGTGFWVDWWIGRGATMVDGCDLIDLAVARLNERFGNHFVQADVSRDEIGATYELVSAMNVLLHITDDEAFRRALIHLASAVRPGGHLLLLEPLVTGPEGPAPLSPGASSVARVAASYVDPVVAAGLQLVSIAPATALGSDPIENGRLGQVWRRYWARMVTTGMRFPRLAPPIGRGIYCLDPLLLAIGASPSEKFVLFRKR